MSAQILAASSLLAAAAVTDWRSRRIPNPLVLAGLLAGAWLAFVQGGGDGLLAAGKAFGIALALMLPGFALRIFGAGDAKLVAVLALFVPLADWFMILAAGLVASGLLALAGSIASGRAGILAANLKFAMFALASRDLRAVQDSTASTAYRVPFAVALLLAWLGWLALGGLR